MADVVFTNHVKDRMYERKISENSVYQTVTSSDENFDNKFIKRFGNQTLTAITKRGDRGEYVVLSAWIDPPNPGTSDEKKKGRFVQMKKAGTLKKLWLTFLNQLGV